MQFGKGVGATFRIIHPKRSRSKAGKQKKNPSLTTGVLPLRVT